MHLRLVHVQGSASMSHSTMCLYDAVCCYTAFAASAHTISCNQCTPARLKCRYSFDHGPIHFLQFSTEHDFSPGSEQFAWIVTDLKTVDRRRTPWLIAGFHRPFYTDSVYGNSDTGDVGFTADIQNALERLFFQFQVDFPPLSLMRLVCPYPKAIAACTWKSGSLPLLDQCALACF